MLLQALVAALSDGAVPDLIYLDMRGNPLTEAGVTSLVNPPCLFSAVQPAHAL